MIDRHMVFDVESVGLHGEGFAVGWVVIQRTDSGKYERVHEGWAVCPPSRAHGTQEGREWVDKNVCFVGSQTKEFHHLPEPVVSVMYTSGVRRAFWSAWHEEKAEFNTNLWADCGWPVEARFLIACVEDERQSPDERGPANDLGETSREWTGPYPFHEISTLQMAVSGAGHGRLEDELPAHHPLTDARHSARLLGYWLERAK